MNVLTRDGNLGEEVFVVGEEVAVGVVEGDDSFVGEENLPE